MKLYQQFDTNSNLDHNQKKEKKMKSIKGSGYLVQSFPIQSGLSPIF